MNIFILIRLTQNNTTKNTMFTFSDKGDKLRVVISVRQEHILYPCCLAIYYNSFITTPYVLLTMYIHKAQFITFING